MAKQAEEISLKEGRGESINIARKIYCEESFDEIYPSCKSTAEDEQTLFQTVAKTVCKPDCSVTCFLYSIFPILSWLPKYKIKKDLIPDITGGFTVLVMHVPQGAFLQIILIIFLANLFCAYNNLTCSP